MKKIMLGLVFTAMCTPAYAQLGGFLDRAAQARQKAEEAKKKADEAKKKVDALIITDEEEQQIGADVSLKIRERFGVVQDEAVHTYVTLVGTAIARQTERPNIAWTFIVLDTDGVNAFASPGGFVHITRGALGLIHNEAELAAVMAHEIGHVAHKHTVNAIRKANEKQLITDYVAANRGIYLDRLKGLYLGAIIEGKFERDDELDADAASVTLTGKLGYAPASLANFLTRLDDRNKDTPQRNGLFASHPETKERIETVKQLAGSKTGALVEARYKANITYEATSITSIAVIVEGSAGLTGSGSSKDDGKDKGKDADKKEEEPKKKGFGPGALKPTVAPEQQTAQVSASGGARGVGPDRAAKGGSNSKLVKVTVSAADVEAFKKGIA